MSWRDVLTNNHAAIHGIFTPEGMGTVSGDRKAVLASYNGPGREQFLRFWESKGQLPHGTADAAAAGMSPQDLGRAVQSAYRDQASGAVTAGMEASSEGVRYADQGMQAAYAGRQTLGMAVPHMVATPQGAAAVNPVYAGLMGQQMAAYGYAPAATQESVETAAADGRRMLAQYADAASQAQAPVADAMQDVAGLVDGAPVAANTGEGLLDVSPEVLAQLGHAPAADAAAVDAAAAAAKAVPAADDAAAGHAAQMQQFVSEALDYLATQHPQQQVDVLAATLANLAEQGKIEPIEQLLAGQLGRVNPEDVAPALWKAIENGGAAADVAAGAAHESGAIADAAAAAHDVAPLLARVGEDASPAVAAAAARLAAGQGRMMSMEAAIRTAIRELPK